MEKIVLEHNRHDLIPNIYGYEACAPNHSAGPAMRPYYLLHYVLEGKGTYVVNNKKYTVTSGDIFVIRPGIVSFYCADTAVPWKYAWLGFHYPGPLPCLEEAVIRNPPVRHIFTYIRDHLHQDMLDGKIFSLVHELIWLLSDTPSVASKRTSSYADYTKAYIDSTYMQPISISALAQSMHIDRRYLTRQFKAAYGIPPQEYLVHQRLENAARFLSSGYTVTETALMAGFSDLPNFSRCFKEFFGLSPAQYRKQVKDGI